MHFCEGTPNPGASGDRSRQSDARNLLLATALRDSSDSFSHQRGSIEASFTGDDEIGGTQSLRKFREAREQFKSGFQPRAHKRHQSEAESARSAGAKKGLEFRLQPV